VKEVEFYSEHAHEIFMEAKKSFTEASTSRTRGKPDREMDPFMIMTFLETYKKSLHDSKDVKGLQKLINRCTRNTIGEPRMVQKIGKHKARIGCEMRVTVQIGEYEME